MAALPAGCHDALADIVGADHVLTDVDALALASFDLIDWPGQRAALCVIRPRDTAQVSEVVRLLARFDVPVVPRGAGLSYSGGAVPHDRAAILDLCRLDTIEVDADNLVAVAGAGATWAQLSAALASHGLKTVQYPPVSGIHTTLGGAAAQGMPAGAEGFIGVTVVQADGAVIRTGSAANRDAGPFQRYWGPDLTGLFLGDCGAFGIKTGIVMKLTAIKPQRYASFDYADHPSCLRTMTTLLARGLVARVFANGPGGAPGTDSVWKLNIVVEAATDAAVDDTLRVVREIAAAAGRETANTLPATLAAKPYSIRGFVGMDGERWLPVHGVLPLSQAAPCLSALTAVVARHQSQLDALGITTTCMVSSVGHAITIEPMLYWRDALTPLHLHYLGERNRQRFADRPDAVAARTAAIALRDALRRTMDSHGAAHVQLGRFFPYLDALDADTATLVRGIKTLVDPHARMNPGVLGLG